MMKNRIEINGEWYVKESSISAKENTTELISREDIITFKSSVWENKDFCFEATHDLESGDLEMIEFTDKRNQKYPFTEKDVWDSKVWFDRVIDDAPSALEDFDNDLRNYAKAFIKHTYDIYKSRIL